MRSKAACNYAVRGLSSLARIIGLSVTVTIKNSSALCHQWNQTDWQLIWMPARIFLKMSCSSDITAALVFKGFGSLISSGHNCLAIAKDNHCNFIYFIKLLQCVSNYKRPHFVFINKLIYNSGQRVKRQSVSPNTGHMILHKSTK